MVKCPECGEWARRLVLLGRNVWGDKVWVCELCQEVGIGEEEIEDGRADEV